MAIAQRLVAGEGDVHPAETDLDFDHLDTFECDVKNLPYKTLRAHQRALSMIALPRRARAALAAIVLTASNARPLKEIFASREYLSRRAGVHVRTWYRAEADLIALGFITVCDQSRIFRTGHFSSAYIHLTELAAKALGLIGEPVPPTRPAKASEQQEPSEATPTPTSFEQPCDTKSDVYTDEYQSPSSSQKRQQGELPRDLERLLPLGFHKNFVFLLMAEARRAGKRLSDVVEATWENLKAANRPINYLRALLKSPTDFAWIAKTKRVAGKQPPADGHAHADDAPEVNLEHFRAKTFYAQDAHARYEITADGSELSVLHASERVVRRSPSGWQAGFVDAIRCGAVLHETLELAAAFKTACKNPTNPTKLSGHAVGSSDSRGSLAVVTRKLLAARAFGAVTAQR
ncbi:replication protein O [Paraburkholderia tropica]|uniref:replication protein O n=1 Tax=Paraburkholderia tropica TaxID=92647 RepID=UPI002AB71275|nr:replication protein O [Paraburkholderia tropica]